MCLFFPLPSITGDTTTPLVGREGVQAKGSKLEPFTLPHQQASVLEQPNPGEEKELLPSQVRICLFPRARHSNLWVKVYVGFEMTV